MGGCGVNMERAALGLRHAGQPAANAQNVEEGGVYCFFIVVINYMVEKSYF